MVSLNSGLVLEATLFVVAGTEISGFCWVIRSCVEVAWQTLRMGSVTVKSSVDVA